MDKLREYYDKIGTRYTAEEMAEKIMSSGEASIKLKKRSPKRFIGAAAGIAAVLSCTVVGAATGWDYFGFFSDKYGEDSKYLEEYAISDVRIIEDTAEDFDCNLVAAVVDNHSMQVVIDAMGDEEVLSGVKFSVGSLSPLSNGENSQIYDEKIEGGIRYTVIVTGNHNSGEDVHVIGRGKDGGAWVARFTAPEAESETIYLTEKDIEIPMVSFVPGVDSRLEENRVYSTKKIATDKITVSPICLTLTGEYEEEDMTSELVGPVPLNEEMYIELKNGERVALGKYSARGQRQYKNSNTVIGDIYFSLERPINPEEAERIIMGERVTELDSEDKLISEFKIYENLTSSYKFGDEIRNETKSDVYRLKICTDSIHLDGVIGHFWSFGGEQYCITDEGERIDLCRMAMEGMASLKIEAVGGEVWWTTEKTINPERIKTIVADDRIINLK